jgi:hypothetical protein
VWNIRSTAYDALVNGNEVPSENEYYSDLTPAEIIDLIKNSRIGGMRLYYYNAGEIGGRIITMNNITVINRGNDDFRIEASTKIPTKGTSTYYELCNVNFNAAWNQYSVDISVV